MIKFISVVAVLVVVMIHPIFLFLAAAIGIPYIIYTKIDWLTSTAEDIFTPAKPVRPKSQSSEDKGPKIKTEDFITYEDKIAQEMARAGFKEGFKDDPEWQKKTKILKEQAERANYREYCAREGIEQRAHTSS